MSDQKEEPQELTPEARQLLQRARRFFVIFVGILLIGFVSIAATLFYRVTRDDGGTAGRYQLQQIALPSGSEVISVAPDGDALVVTFRVDGDTSVAIFDAKSGEIIRQVPVTQ
ncbi:MAG: hypothetical protein KDJ19_11220 [Hyphomicrobiaceae bacterium]|nr:hypothetical protein [Hyphomicrobiaceae bacterium]MCC0024207.1 hypothetical protein [Hyphomicrobiaceae bacterium]